MNKTIIALATVAGLAASGSAFAQALDFNALDADASGAISMEELQVAIPDINEETFGLLDTDGNGELSQEEFNALVSGGTSTGAPANTMEAPAGDAMMEAPAAQ